MKLVTEFISFTLVKGLKAKAALAAEGKTPEEIQTGLGEAFKLEGDKLKHFTIALDVAGQNTENLKRVLVVTLAEGEAAPQKATHVEEHHYVPEFLNLTSHASASQKTEAKGKGRQGGRGGDSKKGSPWGLSPEEKAAKKGAGTKAH